MTPSNETPESKAGSVTFADLDLRPELLEVLSELGYEEPTPIQREAIPPMLAGQDLLAQAATGTGKTAAFALPVLSALREGQRAGDPTALILVPTRELAIQVSEAMHRYGRGLKARVLPVYGGQPIGRQLSGLQRGVDIVVATPGRALDHLNRNSLDLASVSVLVLDEADEMLDMGFADEMDEIIRRAPKERQTVLFSATLPSRINTIAKQHLQDPIRIEIDKELPSSEQTPLVRQSAYLVTRPHKAAAIGRLLDAEAPAAALVFCRTREQVDQLTETLNGRGYRAEALHGGMDQNQRDRVMARLRNETADLIVATDVAARGLDIDHLTHVINYDVPSSPDAYVHRVGRVGRAGRQGVAITLTEPREHRMLKTIERVIKQRIAVEKLPTVADLRTRRLELTRVALQESLLDDNFDAFRSVVETLTDDFDLMEVALAAVKLAHEATAIASDEEDIPEQIIDLRGGEAGRGRRNAGAGSGGKRNKGSVEMTRIFVGAGRRDHLRPQDVVGAITGETSLSGSDVGSISIAERFTLVEVPETAADEVIGALRATKIKGKRPTIRRERF